KDLGVIVDNKFNFNLHINDITHMASFCARSLIRCFISRNKDLLMKAFCTYVRPLVEYCSPVWSPHYKYQVSSDQD
ncbi:hypothetical protein HELRODRAFT_91792, partial [Helobdella robusta]|uniref:Uncharacterized protein n=1 Tax=Helobdella robusta TaxID=6412 RepID=T1G891_HELRO